MPQVTTSFGCIEYTLLRKKVKNLNLRIKEGGFVFVSAPFSMPQNTIENFIIEKADWVIKHQLAMAKKAPPAKSLYSKEECLAIFTPISQQIFPLFATLLNGEMPTLKVREMRTRWGVCHIQKRVIVLNSYLAEKPLPAIEYVILHEYVHFLHPNHQAGFHQEMLRLMPDYKERKKLLK